MRSRASMAQGAARVAALILLSACSGRELGLVEYRPNQEDRLADGAPHTPSTQSLTRFHHWMDSVRELQLVADSKDLASITFRDGEEQHRLQVVDLPLEYLVPRLHYPPASPPDAFDAFNLLLAEYSRNSVAMATGESDESGPRFQTDLDDLRSWVLEGDFRFVANPLVRPLRISIINNCLAPGLWEVSASDRTGEIHHAWFEFPSEPYERLMAKVNGVPQDFAAAAVRWRTEPVQLDLDRLRTAGESIGQVAARLAPALEVGYSSQDSRRKLQRKFALVAAHDDGSELRLPRLRTDLTSFPAHLSSFVPPGKYSLTERRVFDLRFLAKPSAAEIRWVAPKTRYLPNVPPRPGERYIEIDIALNDGYRLIVGNLPVGRLVPQEDFAIEGFGVGILSASDLVERRKLLLETGPAPGIAYLVRDLDGSRVALNSHEYGVEQIFIRALIEGPTPIFQITITSYERIIDLVKYEVEIPPALTSVLRTVADRYVSPLYVTYRDDNVQ